MKYLLIIILILTYNVTASDWKLVHYEKFQYVQSINCPDSYNCYVLVNHPGTSFSESGWRLYKSTDQGYSWKMLYRAKNIYEQEDPQILNVNECVSPSPDYYFVASDDGAVIIKSTDGGLSFRKIVINSSNEAKYWELGDLAMYDTLIGFVTDRSNYFTTKDGWETFEKHPKLNKDQTYYSPIFMDSNTVVMIYLSPWASGMGLGEAFVKYDIANDRWDTLYYFERDPSAYFNMIKSIYFINDTLGFGCGYRFDTALPDGRYYDIIYRTIDGGKNWELIHKDYLFPWVGFYNNISFHDEKNGIAVGYRGKIAMTKDGGDTWVYEDYPNEMKDARKMLVSWAGKYPLIGTWDAGIFRYEGNFFGLQEPDTIVNLFLTFPENGDTNVSISTKIFAKFYDVIDTSKFTNNSFILQNMSNSGSYIKGKFEFDFSDSTLNFTPDSSLHYSSIIKVNLDSIYDRAGNVLSEYSYTFSTEPDSTIGVNDFVKYLLGDVIISVSQKTTSLFFSISDENFRKYKLQISDIMGNVVLEQELNSGIGALFIPVDISSLTNGAYLFMISTGGFIVKTGKFISITN